MRKSTATIRKIIERVANVLVFGENVLAYLRSSSDEQDRSCGQQLLAALSESKNMGAAIGNTRIPAVHSPRRGVFVDEGWSGWSFGPEERPASSELLAYCKAHPRKRDDMGVIVIWALSRLGRFSDGPEEAIYWIYTFRRLGWLIRSVTQPGLDDPNRDRLMRVIKAALESEKDTSHSEEKSKGVARGKQDQIRRGEWLGGMTPFGYERWAAKVNHQSQRVEQWVERLPGNKRNGNAGTSTVLRPNPRTAKYVRLIFRWYGQGSRGRAVSMAEIALRLVQAKVSPHKGGKTWYHTTIGKVLANEAYVAVQRDRDGEAYPALWAPLITRDLWNRAQRKLEKGSRPGGGSNSVYVLSGLLQCRKCQRALHGDRTDGVHYYKASRRGPGLEDCAACTRRVRADMLEPLILAAIPKVADHQVCKAEIQRELQSLRNGKSSARSRVETITNKISDKQNEVERLVRLVGLGGVAEQKAKERLEALNQEIQGLEIERARAAKGALGRVPAKDHADRALGFNQIYDKATPAERRQLVAFFIHAIQVDYGSKTVSIAFRKPAADLSTAA